MKITAIICSVFMLLFVGCNTNKNLSNSASTANSGLTSADIMKNKQSIRDFYGKALTVNGETRPSTVLSSMLAEGYKSSSSVDAKNAKQLMGQLEFFWKIVPDLKWEPQEIINEGDVYIVRSCATGTPKGDFMGVPTDGTKSFEIMTIDMHTLKDGMFVSTHHVEDWATAIKQLMPNKGNASPEKEGAESMKIALAFMDAMGKGEMEKMMSLMHEDMVWQNGGDTSLPWIGLWEGKKIILEQFLPAFGANFTTTKWETEDAFASGNTVAFFGQMKGLLNKSNQSTKEFTWALRVKVKDGKVILWNWFEDSFEVSRAYHNR